MMVPSSSSRWVPDLEVNSDAESERGSSAGASAGPSRPAAWATAVAWASRAGMAAGAGGALAVEWAGTARTAFARLLPPTFVAHTTAHAAVPAAAMTAAAAVTAGKEGTSSRLGAATPWAGIAGRPSFASGAAAAASAVAGAGAGDSRLRPEGASTATAHSAGAATATAAALPDSAGLRAAKATLSAAVRYAYHRDQLFLSRFGHTGTANTEGRAAAKVCAAYEQATLEEQNNELIADLEAKVVTLRDCSQEVSKEAASSSALLQRMDAGFGRAQGLLREASARLRQVAQHPGSGRACALAFLVAALLLVVWFLLLANLDGAGGSSAAVAAFAPGAGSGPGPTTAVP